MSGPVLRFAPSPNGRLHLGHAYSALLNADIAARLGGRLLLRIEDIDPVRSRPELVAAIYEDLAWLGLRFDGDVRRQSEHLATYADALDALARRGLAYPCFCSRGEIAANADAHARDPDGAPLYPGTCRGLSAAEAQGRIASGEPHTWRLDMARALAAEPGPYGYRVFGWEGEGAHARSELWPRSAPSPVRERAGVRDQDLPDRAGPSPFPSPARERGPAPRFPAAERMIPADPARWGDAVIARRDVPTSYHLAVVIDDAGQGVTHVVRGRDLEAATDLHVLLQRLLGLPSPAYHHHGLIRDAEGRKLAKSKGSEALADLRVRGVSAEEIRARPGFVR